MTNLNAPRRNIRKDQRAKKAQGKRLALADPKTLKLKIKPPPTSISGKRKRKLFKKWRQEQKAALQNGSVTMEDIQMMAVDNEVPGDSVHEKGQDSNAKGLMHLHVKKRAKLKLRKGKGKENGQHDSSDKGDAMVE